MSELNPRELPHEFLLRKYGLSINQLSNHTKQLKTDLDKTLRLILSKSINGNVNITPTTQSKIETYDRYICDGIFEFLENNNLITENQSDTEEKRMDSKRDNVVDKMEESKANTPNSISNSEKQKTAKIGFWSWS
jgi:hydroxylamine reductase (hybrid-cluster protein)